MLELPDAVTRITGVVRGRDRPERVGRLDDVGLRVAGAPGRAGVGADEQRGCENENEEFREHVFAW